jgi:hypothetical protein
MAEDKLKEMKSLSTEKRTIPVPPGFAAQAHIKSFEQYKKMYDESINNPAKFWLEQAAKNVKLAMHDANEDVVLVPGVDTSAFVRLTPQNPEHSAFLLMPNCAKPAPAKPAAE